MSLLSNTFAPIDDESNNHIAYNTGTLFDLATGMFVQGIDGKMYLNGGLGSQINVVVGPNGNFKSTLAGGAIVRAAAIYNDGALVIRDTENSISKDKDRVTHMAEELEPRLNADGIQWLDAANYSMEQMEAWLMEHCKQKEDIRKDALIETPILDLKTGKPYRQLAPTFFLEDSLSEDYGDKEEEMLNDVGSGKSGMADSNANTVYMKDGNKKTLWTRVMRRRCEQMGIVLVVTGHYDQKMSIDAYHPNPKETLFGKQDWVVKGVGSKLKFLSSIYARTQAILLQDSNKEALYSDSFTPAKDIFEVDMMVDRCKATMAGTMTPFVCSQTQGFLNAVTNYHYIRLDDFWGCGGNKQKQQLQILPDITISRNTIRQIAQDPKVRRALEITAQLCYIKNNWNPSNVGYDLKTDPKKIFDQLISDKCKDLKSEILSSRSWWSPKKESTEYLSVIDILDRLK